MGDERLCHLGIMKKGFSAYSRPVNLVSRKLMKDKRCVSDFRLINARTAKTKLAFPLVKDKFSMLGSHYHEALLVIDLKDAFHSLIFTGDSKKYCGILPYIGCTLYTYQRMSVRLNYPQQLVNHIWMQFYTIYRVGNTMKQLSMIC